MFNSSFPFYRQLDSMDCGATCIRMIASHYGKKISIRELRENAGNNRIGSSFAGLSEAAELAGFRTFAGQVKLDKIKELPVPFIAHWNQSHYVVVYKVSKETVYVADPAYGLVRHKRIEFNNGWTTDGINGLALFLEPASDFKSAAEEKDKYSFTGFLYGYASQYKKLFIQLFFGLLLGSFLSLIFPFLTQSIVDVGITTQNLPFLYTICLAQLMLFAGRTAVDIIRSRVILHIGSRISISLVSDYLVKMMKLPISFFDARNTGDILYRSFDYKRIESFLTTSVTNILFSLLNLLVFGGILIIYSFKIFLIFLTATIISLIWVKLFLRKRQNIDRKRFKCLAENQNKMIEMINGMQEIKLTGSEKQHRWHWEELQIKVYDWNVKSLQVEQYLQTGALFINEVKNILITFYAATLVIQGQLTVGMMLAITYIVGQLNNPVQQFLDFLTSLQDAKISLERFTEVFDKQNEDSVEQEKRIFDVAEKDLTLSEISFRYGTRDTPYALKNVSINIPHGKITAIVGTSGSGKTTLLKLLLKFYNQTSGNIRIGNIDFNNISAKEWRKRCGVVMQDGYIFSDTIIANITTGSNKVNYERLDYACKVANIHEFIESLPLGYNTKIGQEGVGLSQGQKQRLLIARVAYRNPDFIFFDEATNALDANNEKIIINNLNKFFYGKTVIVVAHRLSTVVNADQIIVIEKGEITESGSHRELTEKKGAYFNLVKNQLELGS